MGLIAVDGITTFLSFLPVTAALSCCPFGGGALSRWLNVHCHRLFWCILLQQGLPELGLCMLTMHTLSRLAGTAAEGCLLLWAWRLSGHLLEHALPELQDSWRCAVFGMHQNLGVSSNSLDGLVLWTQLSEGWVRSTSMTSPRMNSSDLCVSQYVYGRYT